MASGMAAVEPKPELARAEGDTLERFQCSGHGCSTTTLPRIFDSASLFLEKGNEMGFARKPFSRHTRQQPSTA